MKRTLRVRFGVNITIASFLCTATLHAQSFAVPSADVAFSPHSQFNLPLNVKNTISMTGDHSIANLDLSQDSQRPPIPFAQIQRSFRVPAMSMGFDADRESFAVPENSSSSSEPPFPASSSAGFTRAPATGRPGTLDAKYFSLNGLQFSMAIADIETTQHCIDEHTCREGNPLMPSSLAGKFSVSLGIAALTAVASYHLKKEHSKGWWLAPTIGIAGHAVGMASGLVHW